MKQNVKSKYFAEVIDLLYLERILDNLEKLFAENNWGSLIHIFTTSEEMKILLNNGFDVKVKGEYGINTLITTASKIFLNIKQSVGR